MGAILAYLRAAADEHGIDRRTLFRTRGDRGVLVVTGCPVDGPSGAGRRTQHGHLPLAVLRRRLLPLRRGLHPGVRGTRKVPGQVVHPQHWPEELDYAGERVVVIGSGATAVTLVPAMAATAAHVTMLQRTRPTSCRFPRGTS